jgi:uncharacterized membrane protein
MKAVIRTLWLVLLAVGLFICPVSPAGLFAKVDLSLTILPQYYQKTVIPGEETSLFMEVRNNGDTAVTNIRFNYDIPKGWTVNFTPDALDTLSPGRSQTVNVNVVPDKNTRKGDYHLTFFAEANETQAATSIMARVDKGSPFWLWVGVGIATVVVAGFILVFLRSNKKESEPDTKSN